MAVQDSDSKAIQTETTTGGLLQTSSDIDWSRALRLGAIGGVAAVFVSAIGMVETFASRIIINQVLSLSYALLLLIPLGFGYFAGNPPRVLQGMRPPRRGLQNVAAGSVAGLITGLVLAAFVVLASAVDLRSIFINISPQMLQILTFDRELGMAIVMLLFAGSVLGVVGGALHLLPREWRGAIISAFLWTLTIGVLESVVAQLARSLNLDYLQQLLLAGGGLSITGAVIVFVLIFVVELYTAKKRAAVRTRFEQLSERQQRNVKYGSIAVLLLFLAALPQVLGPFLSEVLDLVGIYLLMGLGLNLVVGYAGLLDLGYVAFFAVGAYVTAVLTSPASPRWAPEMTFWAALPFVVLAAACAGIIVGTPVLRLRGDYLAIVTLGFGEIARLIIVSDWFRPILGGAQGIISIPNITLGPLEFRTPPQFFYPLLFFCLIAIYISIRLQDSRIGRAWIAMREDEPVAEAMGINIVSIKLWAFIIGAILASFGGALFATKIGSIFPSSFSLLVSITVLILIIVGGMGSIPGVIIGAFVLVGLPELLREFQEYRLLAYGVLLVVMMLYKPEGLIPSKRRAQELHAEEHQQDAWLDPQVIATQSSTATPGHEQVTIQ